MAKKKSRLAFAETYHGVLHDPDVVALPESRAVVWGVTRDRRRHLKLLGPGSNEELCAPALPDPVGDLAVFAVGAGVALLGNAYLALWPELVAGAPPHVMPISNPEVLLGAERNVRRAHQGPGERTALALITRRLDRVGTDALCYLDWDGERATWRGQPTTLSWEDIPHVPRSKERAPSVPAAVPCASGKALVHQTGGGDGMSWSMISEVDVSTGRSRPIADVALGYGTFTFDGSRLAVSAMRTRKVDLFALDGAPAGSFRFTPEDHAGGDREISLAAIHQSDVWLAQGYGLGRHIQERNIHRCTYE